MTCTQSTQRRGRGSIHSRCELRSTLCLTTFPRELALCRNLSSRVPTALPPFAGRSTPCTPPTRGVHLPSSGSLWVSSDLLPDPCPPPLFPIWLIVLIFVARAAQVARAQRCTPTLTTSAARAAQHVTGGTESIHRLGRYCAPRGGSGFIASSLPFALYFAARDAPRPVCNVPAARAANKGARARRRRAMEGPWPPRDLRLPPCAPSSARPLFLCFHSFDWRARGAWFPSPIFSAAADGGPTSPCVCVPSAS